MKLSSLLFAGLLAVLPGLAMAACDSGHSEASMTCAEGMVFDSETRSCVTKVSS